MRSHVCFPAPPCVGSTGAAGAAAGLGRHGRQAARRKGVEVTGCSQQGRLCQIFSVRCTLLLATLEIAFPCMTLCHRSRSLCATCSAHWSWLARSSHASQNGPQLTNRRCPCMAAQVTVIVRNMFSPLELAGELGAAEELEKEVTEEAGSLGPVEKVSCWAW